ncbi:MAG: alpha/beta hydrolase [Armatimonadota bacterium]
MPVYEDRSNLMHVIDEDGARQPVRTVDDWRVRRSHILENMQRVMGPHPERDPDLPLEVEVTAEERGDGWLRRTITFMAERGDRVPAHLLIPDEPTGAGALCLHQTTEIGKDEPAGLGGKPNLQYARELAERGFVALAPDYPGYGDYHVDPYRMGYASATMKGIVNHERCVDLLASLDEVDAGRIGCVGHSLGGHNALFVAAFDDRIRAIVSSCGFGSFHRYDGGYLKGWSHDGYMPRIATEYHRDPEQMPFDFTEALGAMAPRHVFINAPVADSFTLEAVTDCLEAARPVYALHDATDRLVAAHPDCGHDFPGNIREEAYVFLADAFGSGEWRLHGEALTR